MNFFRCDKKLRKIVRTLLCRDLISSFFKCAKPGAFFVYFHSFSHDKYSTNLTVNDKSVDGVLGTRTRGGSMVGADASTELWRHPFSFILIRLLLRSFFFIN